MTSDEVTNLEITTEPWMTSGAASTEPWMTSGEASTEPWVRFGGQTYIKARKEKYKTLCLGQVMVAANFTLPDDMKFGEGQVISIIAYSILLIIGLSTNCTSLFYLLRDRLMKKDRNRMSLLLIHLSAADLLVS